ncbi:conserved hypothetical protein [Ricinus communis]|uniref:Uncharacterized protein n=1 Tax=Ricinus communis TaxID=3988 RepID=B9S9T0_RICCO|nr:conserved hypothetical protein [Ricinus communis]
MPSEEEEEEEEAEAAVHKSSNEEEEDNKWQWIVELLGAADALAALPEEVTCLKS